MDANNGYIAGELGTCLKTIDGGANWTSLSLLTGNGKVSVFFNDVNTGYVSGVGWSDAIMKTTNGGATWSNSYTNNTEEFSSIYFTGMNEGYAVSSISGKVLKTINAGADWTTQVPAGSGGLYAVKFPTVTEGFIVGGFPNNSRILKTTDSGATWTPQTSSTTEPLFDVFFINSSVGYAVGKNGAIIKTTNGGQVGLDENQLATTWTIYPNPANDHFAIESEHGVKKIEMIDLNGKVIKSVESETTSIDISDVALGLYTIQVTTDQGISRKKLIRQH